MNLPTATYCPLSQRKDEEGDRPVPSDLVEMGATRTGYTWPGAEPGFSFAAALGFSLDSFERCRETADWLLARTRQRPRVAIVCGTGLGPVADSLEPQESFQYTDIPNFPRSTGTAHLYLPPP
ncbi:Purine nucleoside phosphorylase [Varanus komodoensis]|nr:Purine nucleoside phosphorylase [Varanus komodoensis]